jgi:hypothetical protein
MPVYRPSTSIRVQEKEENQSYRTRIALFSIASSNAFQPHYLVIPIPRSDSEIDQSTRGDIAAVPYAEAARWYAATPKVRAACPVPYLVLLWYFRPSRPADSQIEANVLRRTHTARGPPWPPASSLNARASTRSSIAFPGSRSSDGSASPARWRPVAPRGLATAGGQNPMASSVRLSRSCYATPAPMVPKGAIY